MKTFFKFQAPSTAKRLSARKSRRALQFEPLEERALLAVTAADFEALRTAYPDLGLSSSMNDYNVIEITAEQLSEISLRNAITTAGKTTKNDLIVVRTTEQNNSVTLTGGSLFIQIDPTTLGSVAIVSLGDEKLTIDANQKSKIINVSDGELALGGLTLTGGKSSQGAGIDFAYFSTGHSLTLDSCIVSNNHATDAGGGIFSGGSQSQINLANTVVEGNSAQSGGGVFTQGNAVFYKSTITGNTGDGINSQAVMLMLNESAVLNNTGHGISGSGMTIIAGSVISDNHSSGAGAGIYQNGGLLSIGRDSVISDNVSGNYGGGIYALDAVVNISETTVSNNDAQSGGGISVTNSHLNCLNVTMAGNTASANGGGINISLNLEKKVVISNSLIADNVANIGGGIYQEAGPLTLYNVTIAGNTAVERGGGIAEKAGGGGYYNSIIAKNEAPVDVDYAGIPGGSGMFISYQEYTLIGSSDDYSAMNGSNGCIVGTGDNPIDPMFVDAANGNYRLLQSSPALDAGSNIRAVDFQGNALTVDLDGRNRITGNLVDMGAYERSNEDIAEFNEWIGPNGGDWFDPQNWGYGHVPTADDDVFIAAGKHVQIACKQSYALIIEAKSVRCEGDLSIVFQNISYGDGVSFSGYVEMSGTLTLGDWMIAGFDGGANLTGNIVTGNNVSIFAFYQPVTITGLYEADNIYFYAAGTTLSLPNLVSFTFGGQLYYGGGFRAQEYEGREGVIDMPSLTTIVNPYDTPVRFSQATGRILFPKLTDITGIRFEVSNSVLDLSHLTTTTLVNVYFDILPGAEILGLEKITAMTDGTIYVYQNAERTLFPALVSLTNTSIEANQIFPALTSYTITKPGEFHLKTNSGKLEFPALKTIGLKHENAELTISASTSRDSIQEIHLPELTAITGGTVTLSARGYSWDIGAATIYATKMGVSDNITITESGQGFVKVKRLELSLDAVPQKIAMGEPLSLSWNLTNVTAQDINQAGVLNIYLVSADNPEERILLRQTSVNVSCAGKQTISRTISVNLPGELSGFYTIQTEFFDIGLTVIDTSSEFEIANPGLSLEPRHDSIKVNDEAGISFTAAMGVTFDRDVELTVSSSNPDLFSVPETIIIPAGENFIHFWGIPNPDYIGTGDHTVTVTVSAEGMITQTSQIQIIDLLPAELLVESLTVSPHEFVAGSTIDVSWLVRNRGELPYDDWAVDHIYISDTGYLIDGFYVAGFDRELYLEENSPITRNETITIPTFLSSGTYWIILEMTGENNTHLLLASEPITILANELTLTSNISSIKEDNTDGVEMTLTRTGSLSEDLIVQVTTSDSSELTVPQTVTIPAGESSVTFKAMPVQDNVKDGNQTVTIIVSAEYYGSQSLEIIVLDVTPVELVNSEFSVPAEARPGANLLLSWWTNNIGDTAAESWVDNVYISTDGRIENATLLTTYTVNASLQPEDSYYRLENAKLPQNLVGTYYMILESVYDGGTSEPMIAEIRLLRESYTAELTMPEQENGRWTIRRNAAKIEIVDMQNKTIFEDDIAVLNGLVITAPTRHDAGVAVDFSNGDWSFENAIKLIGHEERDNTIALIGSGQDETFYFQSSGIRFNDLNVKLSHVENISVVGQEGDDTAMIIGPETNGTYTMSDNSFVMQAGGQHVELSGFNRINAFADGANDEAYVYGQNDSLIIMNDQYVERRGENQSYRVWRSEQVIATNMDNSNNAIMHRGSQTFDHYTEAEKYGFATDAAGTYRHEWFDFTLANVASSIAMTSRSGKTDATFSGLAFETQQGLPQPLPETKASPATAMPTSNAAFSYENELRYARQAEEQRQANNKKRHELFDDIDNWLEDFDEFVLHELRK